MKLLFKIIFIGSFAFLISILIYFNTDFYIKKQFWKSVSIARISDFIKFQRGFYEIKGRTILYGGKPVAKIIFCWGKELYLEELKSKAVASYTNKDFEYF